MTVLLAGGCGYIGSHIAVVFIKAGLDVVIADNFINSDVSVVERIGAITGIKPPVYEIDIANRSELKIVFSQRHISVVIHLAGYKSVKQSKFDPVSYYWNNLTSTLNLLEVMREYGCKTILFASSASVYGRNCTIFDNEEMSETDPISPYGRSKLMNEQILLDVATADSDFTALILRYFNPVGAHPSGKLGERIVAGDGSLMNVVCQTAAGFSQGLEIYGDSWPTRDGTCERDYIHIMDLAEAHVAALEYASTHKGSEIINLGTGRGTTVLELINRFSRSNHTNIRYFIGNQHDYDAPICVSSPQKANRLLHWKAKRGIDDMCRDAWRWYNASTFG